MLKKFEIDVALNRLEVARYNLYHIKWLIVLDIVGFGIFFYLVYSSFFHPRPETRDLLATISIWAAVALAVGLSQPLIIFAQIYLFKAEHVKGLMARRLYEFSNLGIEISSMGKNARKSWSEIAGVKNIGNILLIFTSPKLAYVIPRRCFESKENWSEFIKFVLKRIKK